MSKVKVYQIGVGDFGRFGFEKLVEMHQNLAEPQVELKGVLEEDFEKLNAARDFAEANGIQIQTFSNTEEMYDAASNEDGTVMVYDAGPSGKHADHIYRSLHADFFHLAEKPPSMTREQHLKERKLATGSDVFWKVDFIERESPVVKKTLELIQGEDIDSIRIFRESSAGIQKILEPGKRSGVQGGDILDKMVHEIYALDLLEASGNQVELDLQETESRYLMPFRPASEKLMDIYGGYTEEIREETATGMTEAEFESGKATVELNSSWLGLSRETIREAERIRELTGHLPIETGPKEAGAGAFESEEARFFMIEGGKNLAGDMLKQELYDLDSGEKIETPELFHDQLYRVIEKSVRKATGREVDTVTTEEIDTFMNAIFDVREKALDNREEFMEQLEKANERVAEKIYLASKLGESMEVLT